MGTLETVVIGSVALSLVLGIVGYWLFNRQWFDPEHGPLTREFLDE